MPSFICKNRDIPYNKYCKYGVHRQCDAAFQKCKEDIKFDRIIDQLESEQLSWVFL